MSSRSDTRYWGRLAEKSIEILVVGQFALKVTVILGVEAGQPRRVVLQVDQLDSATTHKDRV